MAADELDLANSDEVDKEEAVDTVYTMWRRLANIHFEETGVDDEEVEKREYDEQDTEPVGGAKKN